jgi:hypothetical protein
MHRHAISNAAVIVGIATGFAASMPDKAFAITPRLELAQLHGSPQNADSVRVGAEDGRWVIMNSPGVMFKFSYNLRANATLVRLNVSTPTSLRAFVREFNGRQRSGWGDGAFFLPNGELGEHRQAIIDACNAGGRSTNEEHRTAVNLPILGKVEMQKVFGGFRTLQVNGTTMVNVICEVEPPPQPQYEITRFTVQADTTDEICPKNYQLDVSFRRQRLPVEPRADVKFRIMIDNEPLETTTKSMTLRDQMTFVATHQQTIRLDPGRHVIWIKVVGGPESEPKVRDVTCAKMRVNAATLNYAMGGSCPKLVYETTRLKVTRPDWVEYEIEHESGMIVWSDRVKAWREGDGYVAVGQRAIRLGAHDGRYRAREKGRPEVHSDWQRLRVTCP